MLMLMPPYHGALLRADEKGVYEHFARIAEAAPIPIMVQDAPLSGVTLTVPFLAAARPRIAAGRVFQDRGTGDRRASCERSSRSAAQQSPAPSTAKNPSRSWPISMLGRRGRCRAHCCPISSRPCSSIIAADDARMPRPHMLASCRSSTSRTASAGCARPRRSWPKARVIASDTVRHPLEPLHPATRAGLLELVRHLDPIASRWGK